MPNNLQGQFDLISATEGTPVASNDIASFTDSTPGDTAADFTATIDWGDGITTTGTVVGSNGSFTVQGAHTYADEGFPTGVVTITRTTDQTQLVLAGGVTVADADNISGSGQPTIVANPNQALTNVVVATFTDSYVGTGTNDLTVNIDWGDGTTTAGTLSLNGNTYTVTGSHTYAADGQFTITTFLTDNGGDNAFGSAVTAADIGFGGNQVFNSATETIAVPGSTEIATFADNAGLPSTDYTATIDWGDGTTTTGAVSGTNGSFTVTAGSPHTYADEGTFNEVVTITRTTDNATITLTGPVTVADDDSLSSSGTTVTGSPGVALSNVTVATFTDSNTSTPAGEFTATIDWGDGTTSTGTVSGSGGSFSVTDSHTYAQNGQDVITVSILGDQDSVFASVTSTALVGLAPVAGSTLNATEGTAIAAGTKVATFSDSNLGDTAGSFTASIDWGDGTTTNGTVSGSNGSFTVTGGPHTYAEEGSDPVTTTLTRTADSTTATAVGAVSVGEADVLSLTATGISANAGQALNNAQVATFTSTYAGSLAADFAATIDWGDGTTNQGTVTGSGGLFTISGSHTYTSGGTDTLKVSVADTSPGTATASGSATAAINLAGHVVLTSATEGTALSNTTAVATFSDNNLTDTAGSFTATIDWGDGLTTAGSVVGAAGSFTVEGGHTYADEGSDVATVTLTRTADQSSAAVQGTVAVAEADSLTASGMNLSANANQAFNGALATFTDTYTGQVASDLTATINWDDGTTTQGTVSGSNGSFTVSGSHTYTSPGEVFAKVTLADDAPGTATATATTTITIASLSGQMVLNAATEATALPNSTAVATFTDSNGSDTAGSFTASINWGDGVTTAGSVVGSAGSFTVEGGHTYADEGNDPASVTLKRTADNVSATASGTVVVAEDDVLTGHGTTIATTNKAFSGTVATFTDTDTANVAGDFAATINWGDGTTTTGTVSGGSGSFTVAGSHTYASAGTDTVLVTLADDAPGTATATATTTATVRTLTGQMALTATKEGTALPNNTSVATFTDSDTADTASQFSATINWGDGVTTTGTVVGSNGSFTVEGGHTYADEGSDPASVTLTHNPDETQGTASGTVAVAEGDVLTGEGLHIKPKAGEVFSGAVATFSDVDTVNTAGDFAATIDWGDGTTTTGTVTGGSGSFTVDGSHTYAHPGREDVTVTLADDAPGTATATADTKATVSSPGNGAFAGDDTVLLQNTSGNANVMIESVNGTTVTSSTIIPVPVGWTVAASADFNQDGKTDFVLQNSDGLPEIWLMNGTSVTSTVTLPNPRASWHVIAAADFSGNGNPDILWQNTDGEAAIWQMNGTSFVAGAVFNTGTNWHAIGTGDFNGDGQADILWQNTDGSVAIWEMNGTSVMTAAVIGNPGSSWHAIGAADFNGDGNADILWQNADGEAAIWEMNGTSVVAAAVLPNPGANWHAVGTTNVDGNAAILWQNADGTPAIWEMNGFSILTAGTLPNPGATWQVKNDGPIQQPVVHLSSPDGGTGTAGFTPSLPSGLPPQFASVFSSLLNNPVEQTVVSHLLPSTR